MNARPFYIHSDHTRPHAPGQGRRVVARAFQIGARCDRFPVVTQDSIARPQARSFRAGAWSHGSHDHAARGQGWRLAPAIERCGQFIVRDQRGVGESHTGRLYETLTRHLRRWFKQGEWQPHYDRAAVQIAWRKTPTGEEAQIQEALLIAHYKPRDNTQLFVFEEDQPEENERELTPEEAAAVDAAIAAVQAINPEEVPF
jgi:hypothetical protein